MTSILNDNKKLYDRQIRIYGDYCNEKINSSSIVIFYKSYLICYELVKHLSLCGVKNIFLVNNNNCKILFDELDIENTDTKIEIINDDFDSSFLNNKFVIVFNNSYDYCKKISEKCRSVNNCKFIVFGCSGLSGYLFCDYGNNNHQIIDCNESIVDPILISNVCSDGLVSCVSGSSHNLLNNDIITFESLEGDNLNFLKREWHVDVISKELFKLKDFEVNENFKFYNGNIKKIIKPIIYSSETFERQFNERTIVNEDSKFSNKIIDMHFNLIDKDYIEPWSLNMTKRLENFDNDLHLFQNNY